MELSYVIGGSCVEMYVRSYNQVSHSVGSSSLEMFFSTSKSSASYYGYAFNSDSYASSAIDTKGYNFYIIEKETVVQVAFGLVPLHLVIMQDLIAFFIIVL